VRQREAEHAAQRQARVEALAREEEAESEAMRELEEETRRSFEARLSSPTAAGVIAALLPHWLCADCRLSAPAGHITPQERGNALRWHLAHGLCLECQAFRDEVAAQGAGGRTSSGILEQAEGGGGGAGGGAPRRPRGESDIELQGPPTVHLAPSEVAGGGGATAAGNGRRRVRTEHLELRRGLSVDPGRSVGADDQFQRPARAILIDRELLVSAPQAAWTGFQPPPSASIRPRPSPPVGNDRSEALDMPGPVQPASGSAGRNRLSHTGSTPVPAEYRRLLAGTVPRDTRRAVGVSSETASTAMVASYEWTLSQERAMLREDLCTLFKIADADSGGTLSTDELVEIFASMGLRVTTQQILTLCSSSDSLSQLIAHRNTVPNGGALHGDAAQRAWPLASPRSKGKGRRSPRKKAGRDWVKHNRLAVRKPASEPGPEPGLEPGREAGRLLTIGTGSMEIEIDTWRNLLPEGHGRNRTRMLQPEDLRRVTTEGGEGEEEKHSSGQEEEEEEEEGGVGGHQKSRKRSKRLTYLMSAKIKQASPTDVCYHCGECGHWNSDCPHLNKATGRKLPVSQPIQIKQKQLELELDFEALEELWWILTRIMRKRKWTNADGFESFEIELDFGAHRPFNAQQADPRSTSVLLHGTTGAQRALGYAALQQTTHRLIMRAIHNRHVQKQAHRRIDKLAIKARQDYRDKCWGGRKIQSRFRMWAAKRKYQQLKICVDLLQRWWRLQLNRRHMHEATQAKIWERFISCTVFVRVGQLRTDAVDSFPPHGCHDDMSDEHYEKHLAKLFRTQYGRVLACIIRRRHAETGERDWALITFAKSESQSHALRGRGANGQTEWSRRMELWVHPVDIHKARDSQGQFGQYCALARRRVVARVKQRQLAAQRRKEQRALRKEVFQRLTAAPPARPAPAAADPAVWASPDVLPSALVNSIATVLSRSEELLRRPVLPPGRTDEAGREFHEAVSVGDVLRESSRHNHAALEDSSKHNKNSFAAPSPNCSQLRCPLSGRLLSASNAVMAADGVSYERQAIEAWIAHSPRVAPLTGQSLPNTLLLPSPKLTRQERVATNLHTAADASAAGRIDVHVPTPPRGTRPRSAGASRSSRAGQVAQRSQQRPRSARKPKRLSFGAGTMAPTSGKICWQEVYSLTGSGS
jgi:hypothetical protein